MRRKMCIYKCMLNVYKNQQNRQTESRNLMGPKTLPTIWSTYMKLVTKYQISAINSCWEKCGTYMLIFRHIFLSNYWWQKSDISSQASYRYPISWEAFFDPSDSYFLFAKERGYHRWALAHDNSEARKQYDEYCLSNMQTRTCTWQNAFSSLGWAFVLCEWNR
jgi:hypothetical protein